MSSTFHTKGDSLLIYAETVYMGGLSKNDILLISAITPCLAIPVICVTVYLCYLLRDRPKPRPLPPPDMVERMYLEAQRNATLRSQSIFNSTEHIVTSAL
ncbi:Hypothetical predicted protein [Octopus vulgaris]|uniref:Uncharacterized protein n=1 Tax=Octopus vulgaris TaxID=6645 RepID=A0AA36BTI2_OCTVU|nr:Hypothetical predicted protein [Octopus vulgaris]